ncbi:MAG: hypothetical protein ABJP70_01375 [Erythrobacter sp.]
MQMLKNAPDSAYRRVEVDARIEASDGADLTRICLEEVIAALGQSVLALNRLPERVPGESLTRAHGIALWLTRSVALNNPLREQLRQFYGGHAATIRRNMVSPALAELEQVRQDFSDVLQAAQA